jgi:hypothetical protein
MPIPHSKKRIASSPRLTLTSGEAETLLAAVQRIIRASELAGAESQRPKGAKSPRR